jgi:hypothetical protein
MSLGAAAAMAVEQTGDFSIDGENGGLNRAMARFAAGAFRLEDADLCLAVGTMKNVMGERIEDWQMEHEGRNYLWTKAKKKITGILMSSELNVPDRKVEIIDSFSEKTSFFELDAQRVIEGRAELARALILKAELGAVALGGRAASKSNRI